MCRHKAKGKVFALGLKAGIDFAHFWSGMFRMITKDSIHKPVKDD